MAHSPHRRSAVQNADLHLLLSKRRGEPSRRARNGPYRWQEKVTVFHADQREKIDG